MSKRALITGAGGFTGHYMAEKLRGVGYKVWGLMHRKTEAIPSGVDTVRVVDLADTDALYEVVREAQPEIVVHLAAISHVRHQNIDEIYQTNLLGLRHLLQALCRVKTVPRAVLVASSATIYGTVRGGILDEETPPSPPNDYAVSKLAMEHLAWLFIDRLPIILTRPFNYTGVGQPLSFLIPKIIDHFVRRESVIELGNLNVARDFSDVRMIVDCYHRLLETPQAIGGRFNICSSVAYSLIDILGMVRQESGHDLEVQVNQQFVRKNDVGILLGNRARLEKTIGRVDTIPLRETICWMLEEAHRER